MAEQDGPAPIPRRRKTDFATPAEQPLRSIMQMLAARQLVDIWLSELTLGGVFLLMVVLTAASLSSRYHWPPALYTAIAASGLVLTGVGLVGSAVLWAWADRRVRMHDG